MHLRRSLRALGRTTADVSVAALYGLRGVGKTTLAAAYAERHRNDFRATWWIRAQTPDGMRADLVALGSRLGWITADNKEDEALATVMERLRQEGEGILLVFDNALDAAALVPFLPRGGRCQVLVTSNTHAWRHIATPVEILTWSREVGGNYLVARTGRDSERGRCGGAAEDFGGLPWRMSRPRHTASGSANSLAEYRRRFQAAPARLLGAARDARPSIMTV